MKIIVIIMLSVFLIFNTVGSVEGAVTGSENYCGQFPTHPECTGWRNTPLTDNFWFCEYVDLPTMCKHSPSPQKQIVTHEADYCCRLFEDDLNSLSDSSLLSYDDSHMNMIKNGITLPSSYPVNELALWTDKDHYYFGDRVNVYGKFDFGDPNIKNHNNSVDVKFNGQTVMSDVPIRDNGWFAGHFFISDQRFFWNGVSQITVSYIHKAAFGSHDDHTVSGYKFTTGDIKEPKIPFSITILDQSLSDRTISYRTEPTNPVPTLLKSTLISRITNSDGVVFPLPTNSMKDLNTYLDEISSFDDGLYTITMTVGDFTTNTKFEYNK